MTKPRLGTLALLVVLLAGLAYLAWPERAIIHPPGQLAPDEPRQTASVGGKSWNKEGYDIRPLAGFALKALVLHRQRYRSGRESDLSPIDLALGWGPMSDQSVVDKVEVTQSRRWYHWKSAQLPVPPGVINTHSANMHMIPADDDAEQALADVRQGNVVELSGYLVEVKAADGWSWRSSLRRDDTGDGSCEVVWLEKLRVRE